MPFSANILYPRLVCIGTRRYKVSFQIVSSVYGCAGGDIRCTKTTSPVSFGFLICDFAFSTAASVANVLSATGTRFVCRIWRRMAFGLFYEVQCWRQFRIFFQHEVVDAYLAELIPALKVGSG